MTEDKRLAEFKKIPDYLKIRDYCTGNWRDASIGPVAKIEDMVGCSTKSARALIRWRRKHFTNVCPFVFNGEIIEFMDQVE